ncbi:MAG: hypothetical protein WBP89_07025, partial [Sedimenticolaceae bacterium]
SLPGLDVDVRALWPTRSLARALWQMSALFAHVSYWEVMEDVFDVETGTAKGRSNHGAGRI